MLKKKKTRIAVSITVGILTFILLVGWAMSLEEGTSFWKGLVIAFVSSLIGVGIVVAIWVTIWWVLEGEE